MENTEDYFERIRESMQFLQNLLSTQKEDLENYYTEENLKLIRILIPELIDDEPVPDKITSQIFCEILSKLCEVHKKWGRALGETIITAGDLADAGDLVSAIAELEEFINTCKSSYYRKHARNRIKYYTVRRGP